MAKVNLFISYAHYDSNYLDELKMYINEKSCPNVKIWQDGKIPVGSDWDDEIKTQLADSHIVLLLISQAFLNSEYIDKTELVMALKKHAEKKCRVIPIFTRKCNLDKYPQITALQGLPRGMKFLSDAGKEIDSLYAGIQKEINEVAFGLLADMNIANSIKSNDAKSSEAKKIDALRNNRKIFLSLPDSEEGKKQRQDILFYIEGRIRHENWPYEIVPGFQEAKELYAKNTPLTEELLSSYISDSLYSIHIIASENDFENGINKTQYNLAKEYSKGSPFHKEIVWLLRADISQKLRPEHNMNPSLSGQNYERIFEVIKDQDSEKEKMIGEMIIKDFSPMKRVYMFYDFLKDHNNFLRINLKKKVEENKKFSVWPNEPNEPLVDQKAALAKCDGVLIFYGSADSGWYLMRQSLLFKSADIAYTAVCIDEPEMQAKIDRDISGEFQKIKGEAELNDGVLNFLKKIQQNKP